MVENEIKQALETTKEMNDEAYGYFISGLRIAIRAAGYKYEKDFAEGIMNPVTLSNNLTGKNRMREDKIDECANKLNKDKSEIVLMGKKAAESSEWYESPKIKSAAHVVGVEAGYIDPMDIVAAMSSTSSAVSLLAKQCQDENGKKKFWRAIFDQLPVAALIVRDGLVWYQNIKSSAWGNIKGVTLCESCACPEDCKKKHECPSLQAIETRNAKSGYQHIGAVFYKVDVAPLRFQYKNHEYVLIIATEAEQPEKDDRRTGGDRRKD